MRRLNSTVKLNGTATYQILRLYNTFAPNDFDNNGDPSAYKPRSKRRNREFFLFPTVGKTKFLKLRISI
jgi:hypothetical protein